MTEFAIMLESYINKKKVNKYQMAKYISIDRSTLHKIITGQRNAPSKDIVLRIAKYLELTPNEIDDLLELYMISTISPKIYYRRKYIQELFQHFNDNVLNVSHFICRESIYLEDKDEVVFESRNIVESLLYGAIDQEMKETTQEKKRIRILANSTITWLPEIVAQYQSLVEIDHIMPFYRYETIMDYKRDSNFEALKDTLSMYMRFHNNVSYRTYYYYTNQLDFSNDSPFFPYLFITSKYVFQVSANYEKCVVLRKQDAVKKFQTMFDRMRTKSVMFFHELCDVPSQLKHCISIQQDSKKKMIGYQAVPCFVPFFDDEIIQRCITLQGEQREALFNQFSSYVKMIRNIFSTKGLLTICSIDGIEDFLKTGRIDEFPPELYEPLSMEDRKYIVNQFLNQLDIIYETLLLKNIWGI